MESLAILVPVALIFTALIVGLFLWAVRNNQYDDLDKSASSILFDDEPTSIDNNSNTNNTHINNTAANSLDTGSTEQKTNDD